MEGSQRANPSADNPTQQDRDQQGDASQNKGREKNMRGDQGRKSQQGIKMEKDLHPADKITIREAGSQQKPEKAS